MILVNHVDTRFFQLNHFYLKKKKINSYFFCMKIKQQKNEFGHFFHSALIKFGLWPCLSLLNRQHQWLSAVDRGFKTMKLVFVTSMLKYFFTGNESLYCQ